VRRCLSIVALNDIESAFFQQKDKHFTLNFIVLNHIDLWDQWLGSPIGVGTPRRFAP
jgi:hypothetical protein